MGQSGSSRNYTTTVPVAQSVTPAKPNPDNYKCDRILENLPFGQNQTYVETQLKIFTIFLK